MTWAQYDISVCYDALLNYNFTALWCFITLWWLITLRHEHVMTYNCTMMLYYTTMTRTIKLNDITIPFHAMTVTKML